MKMSGSVTSCERYVGRTTTGHGKNRQLAVYPLERHAFIAPGSWVDKYRRILKLFEDNLNKPVP